MTRDIIEDRLGIYMKLGIHPAFCPICQRTTDHQDIQHKASHQRGELHFGRMCLNHCDVATGGCISDSKFDLHLWKKEIICIKFKDNKTQLYIKATIHKQLYGNIGNDTPNAPYWAYSYAFDFYNTPGYKGNGNNGGSRGPIKNDDYKEMPLGNKTKLAIWLRKKAMEHVKGTVNHKLWEKLNREKHESNQLHLFN